MKQSQKAASHDGRIAYLQIERKHWLDLGIYSAVSHMHVIFSRKGYMQKQKQ